MKKTMNCFAVALGVVLCGFSVRSEDCVWFDAGIRDYTSWPSDGSDFSVGGAGTWRATAGARLVGETGARALHVSSDTAHPLDFAIADPRGIDSGVVTIRTTAKLPIPGEGEVMELPAAGAMCALTCIRTSADEAAYFGLAKDMNGGSNAWVRLSGATPGDGMVETVFDIKEENGAVFVRYAVDGVVLNASGVEWLEIDFPDEGVKKIAASVRYAGSGEVGGLAGVVEDLTPRIGLTIPAIEHVSVVSVKANGVLVEAKDGVYPIPQGAEVVVEFAPVSADYALTVSSMTFVAGETDMTLPEEGRPEAVVVTAPVVINEIMASNGTSLKTKNGVGGIDWVELYNDGDTDVNLAGWYLGNDPTKKVSKWVDFAIQGDCVVPAKGYKIVWCDGDGLCPDENFAADEAYVRCNVSTDAGKHTVFLADAEKGVKESIKMPAMMKDVSYGKASDGLAFFREPTPGAANAEHGYGPMTPEVQFSVPHGYKTESFELTLSCPAAPEAQIYYTLDGTSPTRASRPYVGPITISRTTCVRAAVPTDNAVLQYDSAATYLFLDDILRQSQSAVPAGFPASGAVNRQAMRYGMNQTVVGGTDAERLRRGFGNISTISIVIDPKNLFDADTGIYVNPQKDGKEWERQTMLEQINPNGDEGFSVPAGIRIRGAASRQPDHAKHSLRFFFRGEYGMGSLKYPLFGDEGADEFDKVDLRTSQNYSWANENDYRDTFIHECFSRDSQGAMGEHYTRSRYYHLFINGQYWGLYQTQERGDEDFAETYNGGAADLYDVIKTSTAPGKGYTTGASAGTDEAWKSLWDLIVRQQNGSQNYRRAMGLNEDGTRNPDYPVLLNPTNLIAYMLVTHFVCDSDTPISTDGGYPNNLYALRDRVDGNSKADGFFFLRHDAEHSLGVRGSSWANADPTVYGTDWVDPKGTTHKYCGPSFLEYENKFSPAELYWKLCENAEFRLTVADLFYRHCLKAGGALTVPVAKARFEKRMIEIDDAIVAECARWSTDVSKRNRDQWLTTCNDVCLDFIGKRMNYMLPQYRARGWYPSIDAPEADVVEGAVAAGTTVTFACEGADAVYVTTDGSDPRTAAPAADGKVALTALPCKVLARAKKGDEWSALQELSYTLEESAGDGYTFVFSGDYEGDRTIAPTGSECVVILDGATIGGSLVLPAGVKATLRPADGTTNALGGIAAADSALTVDGAGAVVLSGASTLLTAGKLTVEDGTLDLTLADATVAETCAVVLTGDYVQNGGTVNLSLKSEQTVYGVWMDTKNIEVKLNGGTFNASVAGGEKSAAFKLNKGSNDVKLKGTDITVELKGSAPRFVQTKAKITISGGRIEVEAKKGCQYARAFKANETITVSGGTVVAALTKESEEDPEGSEVFSTDEDIVVTGGVLSMESSDDCFSAATAIAISGGIVHATSLRGDALDSNGTMEISGGQVFAFTCSPGHEALDVDPAGDDGQPHTLVIGEGATVVAVGGLQTPHVPDEGSAANILFGAGLSSSKKYVEFSEVTDGESATTDTVYTVSWKDRHAETFTLLLSGPGFDGKTYGATDVKPTDQYEDAHKLNDDVSGVFLREVVTEKASYPEVVAEVARTNEAIRAWVEALYAIPSGKAAIDGFTEGTAETLRECYLVDILPEAEPEIEVEIPSISIGADGQVTVGGELSVHGEVREKSVNGTIRLYHSTELDLLPTSTDSVDLGHAFPIPPETGTLELEDAPKRFFRLKVE